MRQIPPCSLPDHIYLLAKTVVRKPSVGTQGQEFQLSEGRDEGFKAGLGYKVSARSVSETLSKKNPNVKQLNNFRNWKVSSPPNSRTFPPQPDLRTEYELLTPVAQALSNHCLYKLDYSTSLYKRTHKMHVFEADIFHSAQLTQGLSVMECARMSSLFKCSTHSLPHCVHTLISWWTLAQLATFWLRWELLSRTGIKRGCFPWDHGFTEVTKKDVMKLTVESAHHLR